MHLINHCPVDKYYNSPTVQGLIVLSLYLALRWISILGRPNARIIPWRIPSNWDVYLLIYGILRTDINLFLREILLSIVIPVFKKSEHRRFEGRCFLLWKFELIKTEFLGYLRGRVLAVQFMIIPASAITSNDIKIKEIISNFCRPSGFASCRSCMSFVCRITRLGKRKIWDWLLAVWGSLSTCLRELKSSLSFLEARAVNHGGRLYDWSTSKKSIWTIFF